MSDARLSELCLSIVHWCESIGAAGLHQTPGLWEGETEPLGDYGPLTVQVNAHPEPVGEVPAFTFVVHPKGNPLGFVAMVNPYGGSLMAGGWAWKPRELEDMLISHFDRLSKAETPA
jgi:hypothetical protein